MKQIPGSVNMEIQVRMLKLLHSTLQLESLIRLTNFLLTHFLPCLARQTIIFIFNEIFWTGHHIAVRWLGRRWSEVSYKGRFHWILSHFDPVTSLGITAFAPGDPGTSTMTDSLLICVIHAFLLIGLHHTSWNGWMNLAWRRCETHWFEIVHSAD